MGDRTATSLSEKAAAGGRWTATSAGASVIIQFVQLAILGRLLSPTDFGLMAMMMVVVGLAGAVADFGFSNYLVRTKNIAPTTLGAILIITLLTSVALMGVLTLGAPWISVVYNASAISVYMPWLSLAVLFTAFAQLGTALLQKEMRFKEIAIIEVLASLAGLTAAALLALSGKGIWALILSQLAVSIARVMGAWRLAVLYCAISFNRPGQAIIKALHFGGFQMGDRLLNFAGWNIDKFIVGRILGDTVLGIYSVSYQLVLRPFSLLNPVFNRVALPLFAHVQEDDDRLIRGYLKTLKLVALISFPIYLSIIIGSELFIEILLGPKWAEAASVLRILGGLGVFFAIGNPIGSLLLAKGRADIGFYWNIFALLVYMFAILVGSNFGLLGVASAFLLAAAAILFPAEFWLRWVLVRMSPWIYIMEMAPLMGSLFMALSVGLGFLFFISDQIYGGQILAVFFALLTYGVLLLFSARHLLKQALGLVLNR